MSFRFVNIAHLSENVFTSVLHTRITLDDTDQMQTVTFYSPLVWTVNTRLFRTAEWMHDVSDEDYTVHL